MPPETTTPNSSRRSERSRRAILDATYGLVMEKGYAKLTIEAIAARAGVGKQTIYRWWPSKGAVMFDAFFDAAYSGGEDIALPDTGDIEADLKAVLRATVDEYNDPEYSARLRALNSEVLADSQLSAELFDRMLAPGLAAYRTRLEAAQQAGQIAAGADLETAVELLLSPIQYRWQLGPGPLTHAFADSIVDIVLPGLRPPHPEG
ncbi:TetR/AcrR family transcriptional regulator [Nocardiopsis sediminis]|uniref:TetR/AcrR family transcriptional regulator n=1 Tax=Nocardiopsis sediminis TaxID=1778267 RepID=A0ABV8FPE0_9ACTN